MYSILALQFYWNVLKKSFSKFSKDDIFTHAAALAYYTIFSLPPMLLIILYTVTFFYDEVQVQEAIFTEIAALVGTEGAQQLLQTIEKLQIFRPNWWATVLGIGILTFTSTTVFVTMQSTLNKIFRVEVKPQGFGILKMIRDRILSFTLLIGLGFILLVSLTVNALISAFAKYLETSIGSVSLVFSLLTSIVLPFLIITILFATIFKLLPDVNLKWRDTWFGAILTSVLFNIGKHLISFYIGNSNIVGLYDAAGSVMVIMVWVFYASLIFMFGAVFTYVRMQSFGDQVKPSDYAVKI